MSRDIALSVRFTLRGDGRGYALDESGDPRATRTKSRSVFDVAKLMNMLLGIRKDKERGDLAEFFNAAGYLPRRGRRAWHEADLTETVVRRWRVYLKITTTMATYTGLVWGSRVLNPDVFPEDIIERATRVFMLGVPGTLRLKIGPTVEDGGYRPEYASEIETRDPLDAIWVHLQLDRLAGIGYQQCKSRSCGKFFELPFYGDTRKRKREFCDSTCASREQKAREQDKLNEQCTRAVKKALAEYRRLPSSQRTNRSEDIEQLVKRDWPGFPRKENWITSFLKKGKSHGQEQRG